MELTFDQAAELLDEMAEQVSTWSFLTNLNGGILLEEEAGSATPMFPEGEVYFMGEYIQDGYLGNSIQLYYGSFLPPPGGSIGMRKPGRKSFTRPWPTS